MNLLMAVTESTGPHFPYAFTAVYVIGFIAAVSIGSIAWYNSKRPVGWEDKKRPDFIPEVDGKNPGV
ncbi:photosystem II assembly protein Psb35 [Leptodesmis sp.]|uniref:photosystem II assembly protein Psb35 n=1 Tax=Leptodesmis sp. TaxID=3100501 RepID=UPI00405346A1